MTHNLISLNGSEADIDQPMIDQLVLRMHLLIETSADMPQDVVARHIGSLWRITERAGGSNILKVKVRVPLGEGLAANAKVQLRLTVLQAGLSVRAEIRMNGHDVLRQRYGINGGVKGSGGTTNFALRSTDYTEDDLALQFDSFVAVPMTLFQAIVEALPDAHVRNGGIKIAAGEVCLDIPCTEPQEALRKDRLVPQAGTRTAIRTDYMSSTDSGRKLSNKERSIISGPVLIAYEKWWETVRCEAKQPTPAAVEALGISNFAALNHDAIYHLLLVFYHAAGELCCQRKDHFLQAWSSTRSCFDLIAALMPLIRIGLREQADGAFRPREAAAARARGLVSDLLTCGITHAVGIQKGTQVRQVLEDLAGPGGPLTRKQSTVFCVSAAYAYPMPPTEGRFEEGAERRISERS